MEEHKDAVEKGSRQLKINMLMLFVLLVLAGLLKLLGS